MTLNEIETDVRNLHEKIKIECKNNETLKDIYKGCQIYFSNIVNKPEIMLVGYNPGPGYFNEWDEIVENFEQLDQLEYLNNNYDLAIEVKNLFKLINKEKLLEKAFKTNIYFFSTNNVNDFSLFLNLLSIDLKRELLMKYKLWIIELIKIIKPKNIICEGFMAFNEIKNIFNGNMIEKIDDSNFKMITIEDMNVFAFKRLYSNILKKEIVAENLSKYL